MVADPSGYYKTLVYPGISEIKENPQTKEYMLVPIEYKFKLPNKLYGEMADYVDFYWRSFRRDNYIGGVLLTGQKGSGKTLIGTAIANRAIDAGMIVVQVTNIQFKPSLITYLDSLDNVVFFFDEFGKNFNNRQQDAMLTLLSNIKGKQRIVIITENYPSRISEFIRNRPGRIKYALHFNKLPMSTIEEYCSEYDVEPEFYKELISTYKNLTLFQFDHLKAIIEEHLYNKDMPFIELVKLLNLEDIAGKKVVKLMNVVDKEDPEKVYTIINVNPTTTLYSYIEQQEFYITVRLTSNETKVEKEKIQEGGFFNNNNNANNTGSDIMLNLTKHDLKEIIDDIIIMEKGNLKFIFNIVREHNH